MEPLPTTEETSSDIVREIMAAERRMIYVPSNPVSAITVAVPLPVSLTQIKSKPMENAKQNAMKSYWAKMTPEERSAEMLRRKNKLAAAREKERKPTNPSPGPEAPAKPNPEIKFKSCPPNARSSGTDHIEVLMVDGKKYEMHTDEALWLLRRLKSAILASI